MRKSNQRHHYLIDKEIQLGYLTTLLVPIILLVALFSVLLVYSVRDASESTRISLAENVEQIIQESLKSQRIAADSSIHAMLVALQDEVQIPHEEKTSEAIIDSIFWVLIPGVVLGIIIVVFASIRFSHKFAGPVYHLEKACEEIAGGNYRKVITLREGDRLMQLAASFNEMVSSSRMRFSRILSAKSSEEREKIAEELKI